MFKKVFFHFCLLFSLAICSAATPTVNELKKDAPNQFGDTIRIIPKSEKWNQALKRYSVQLVRDWEYSNKQYKYYKKYLASSEEKIFAKASQAELLYFNLLQRNQNDALEIAAYCEKLLAIKKDFIRIQAQFDKAEYLVNEVKARYLVMIEELNSFEAKYMSTEDKILLQSNIEQTHKIIQFGDKWLEEIKNAKNNFKTLDDNLDDILLYSNNVQDKVISNIFFDNEFGFLSVIHTAKTHFAYWIDSIIDSFSFAGEYIVLLLPYLIFDTLIIFVILGAISLALYYWLMKNTISKKMPDFYARRHRLQWVLVTFLLGISLYFSEAYVYEELLTIFEELAVCIITLSILAVGFCLNLDDKGKKFYIYWPMIILYLIGLTVNILMISYYSLIMISTIANLFALLYMIILLFKISKFNVHDRIYIIISTFVFLLAFGLGFIGFAYISLTMMIGWLTIVAQLELLIALTVFIKKFVELEQKNLLLNDILYRFILPILWLVMGINLCYWLVNVYHVKERCIQILNVDIVKETNVVSFNAYGLFFVIFVGICLYFVLSFGKFIISRVGGEEAQVGMVPSFIILSTYILWGIYVLFVLLYFRVHYSSILVVLGGMSMGLGFGMKDMVENFISGIILLIGQQIRPGDIVEISADNIYGKVIQISVRATTIETRDGAIVTYPNAKILTTELSNWTRNNPFRRCKLQVGIPYGSDLNLISKVINESLEQSKYVIHKLPTEIYCSEFGDSAINFSIYFWAAIKVRNDAISEVYHIIYDNFNKNNISIPFPQLDLHVMEDNLPELKNSVGIANAAQQA